jgi:hypothetical protein
LLVQKIRPKLIQIMKPMQCSFQEHRTKTQRNPENAQLMPIPWKIHFWPLNPLLSVLTNHIDNTKHIWFKRTNEQHQIIKIMYEISLFKNYQIKTTSIFDNLIFKTSILTFYRTQPKPKSQEHALNKPKRHQQPNCHIWQISNLFISSKTIIHTSSKHPATLITL